MSCVLYKCVVILYAACVSNAIISLLCSNGCEYMERHTLCIVVVLNNNVANSDCVYIFILKLNMKWNEHTQTRARAFTQNLWLLQFLHMVIAKYTDIFNAWEENIQRFNINTYHPYNTTNLLGLYPVVLAFEQTKLTKSKSSG